jgi:hypothetical protein
MADWTADFSREAGKQFEKLKRSGSRPPIRDVIGTLIADLRKNGPQLPKWPNFGSLENDCFHPSSGGNPALKGWVFQKDGLGGVRSPSQVAITIPGLKAGVHCHLRKGRPTYVACWRIIDKKTKQIEVYYVGSHEGAPY